MPTRSYRQTGKLQKTAQNLRRAGVVPDLDSKKRTANIRILLHTQADHAGASGSGSVVPGSLHPNRVTDCVYLAKPEVLTLLRGAKEVDFVIFPSSSTAHF